MPALCQHFFGGLHRAKKTVQRSAFLWQHLGSALCSELEDWSGFVVIEVDSYFVFLSPRFKSGKLIVLYISENQTVLDVLRTTLGNQFAGM